MNHLELFSGTHSFGKVSHKFGYKVTSLDRDLPETCPFSDYVSGNHIREDIMTWDYKIYPPHHFKLITASPVCLWWSKLRRIFKGRQCKTIHSTDVITEEHIQRDIDIFGIPMVDKVREIIAYFEPKYYIIENPQTGRMKEYIQDLPYYDVDYCKYSDWGYRKRTRFWTNIEGFHPQKCNNDCENIMILDNNQKIHKENIGCYKTIKENGSIIRCDSKELRLKYKNFENITSFNQGENSTRRSLCKRYRIPEKLIEELLKLTQPGL